MEGKSEILHQTNESESTTEAKYYFVKLLLRDSLFGKMTLLLTGINFDRYLVVF